MGRHGRYPQELKDRAVRMVEEHRGEYPSEWSAQGVNPRWLVSFSMAGLSRARTRELGRETMGQHSIGWGECDVGARGPAGRSI